MAVTIYPRLSAGEAGVRRRGEASARDGAGDH